jgi:hypothetical protein
VGYAALNVFVDGRTGRQPLSGTAQELLLNAGAFQLRLRRQPLPPGSSPTATCLDGFDSCAVAMALFVHAL